MPIPRCITGLFLLASLSLGAQDSVVVFKVRDPAMDIQILPKDSVLWTEQTNKITIRVKGEHKIAGLFMKGGTIKGSDSVFSIYVSEKNLSALLTIYEYLPDGSKAVCVTKKYTIKRSPQPILKVCGVKKDSVMDLWDLHIRNALTAYLEEQKIYVPIVEFSMVFVNQAGQSDTLTTAGNKFNLTMREELFRLKPGSSISIVNAKVLLPGGREKFLDPVQIFLAETGKRRVGY